MGVFSDEAQRDAIARELRDAQIFGKGEAGILLVGEAPNRRMFVDGSEGTDALVIPRLVEMSGLSPDEFDRAFGRTNVLREWPGGSKDGTGDAFPDFRAKSEARRLKTATVARRFPLVILLGRRTEMAMVDHRDRTEWFAWGRYSFGKVAVRVAVAPHPSGVSTWWNEEKNREQARAFWTTVRSYVQHVKECRRRHECPDAFASARRFPCLDEIETEPCGDVGWFPDHCQVSASAATDGKNVDVRLAADGATWSIDVLDEHGTRHSFRAPRAVKVSAFGKSGAERNTLSQAFAWIAARLRGSS